MATSEDKVYTQAELDAAVADAVAKATAEFRARAENEHARADAETQRAEEERTARLEAEHREVVARNEANLLRIQNDYERERADRAVQLAYVSILLVHRPRFVLAHSACHLQAQRTRPYIR